ncbi:hypothetical protein FRC12_022239 [Ceratobasidium sp. 428]|nr:hypothetical protein FRC09_020493 [Ceratobasidium sp. 395]KAG8794724.1 hypothetical protein FRC12_022239 [Ceratobasidium sp. 428]
MHCSLFYALALVSGTLSSPTRLLARKDWKSELGWNGTTTTPAQLDPSNVVKPTPNTPAAAALSGGVYFCTDANWAGQCLYVARFNSGQCVNFGNEFNDKVTSFGPDPGLACLLYDAWDCKGNTPGGYLVNPGKSCYLTTRLRLELTIPIGSGNLTVYKFNDVASSFVCKAA